VKQELEKLIKLHDIDLLLKEMSNPEVRKRYKKLGFQFGQPSKALLRARRELTQTIEPQIMAQYERILKRYGDRALAPVINEVCGGCYARLPAELVAHKSEIINCPNCGRFLYWLK
jgi:hypothetical protein